MASYLRGVDDLRGSDGGVEGGVAAVTDLVSSLNSLPWDRRTREDQEPSSWSWTLNCRWRLLQPFDSEWILNFKLQLKSFIFVPESSCRQRQRKPPSFASSFIFRTDNFSGSCLAPKRK